jgi:hypothetical protein
MGLAWEPVWERVAAELDEHCVAGLERLLTEDVVRFTTVRALLTAGVAAPDIRVEWRPPELRGGAVDLVVGSPVASAVEFKYPREPNETNAAWTMHLGEVIKDFYRLAALPAHVGDRLCVQVVSTRLRRYLDNSADRHRLTIGAHGGEMTAFTPDAIHGLPETARRVLGGWADVTWSVRATCTTVLPIGPNLRLLVHRVDMRDAVPADTAT